MVDRVTCPILGPPGIVASTVSPTATPTVDPPDWSGSPDPHSDSDRRVVERADNPEAFRILIAPDGDLSAVLDDTPITVDSGSILLANPGRRLEAAPPETRESTPVGRLFILPDETVRRLVNSLTTGKGGLVRFVQSRIEDRALAAMMADIHKMLMAAPTNRKGEALFIGAVASLLRQYGQIGGIPAASPLKSEPTDPTEDLRTPVPAFS